MKKKFLGRLLTMLLIVSMTLTLLPVPAMAAYGSSSWGSWREELRDSWNRFWNGDKEDTTEEVQTTAQTATTDNSEFLRIFHLDCGRKYFSVDQINAIIDQLAKNNYTHIELAFGNDGLRFLLDDMSVTVGEKTYTTNEVTDAIKYGNTTEFDYEQNYLSASSGELSETNMDLIIKHAGEKGIQVIPMMDVPGHMNAVIQAMDKLGIKGSTDKVYYRCNNKGRSFNPTDTAKVDFVKALMAKYIEYFANKGCEYFNIAGDECGFSEMNSTQYDAYIQLMNDLNTSIKAAGMTTMMFNDGVYYKGSNVSGYTKKFDTDIIICYWTAGTNYETSVELAKSFKLINTYGHWYYVAGNTTNNWGGYQYALNHMSVNGCTTCDGGATADTGCMLAYWCDDPSVEYNDAEAQRVATYIATLAKNNRNYFPEKTEPVTLSLQIGSSTLQPGSSTTVTANKAVQSWSSDSAAVQVTANPLDATAQTATVYAASTGTANITATSGSEKASVNVTVSNAKTDLEERTINVYVGQTVTDPKTIAGDYSGTYETENTGVAIVTSATSAYVEGASGEPVKQTSLVSGQKYIIGDGNGNYLKRDGNSLTNTTDPDDATEWTITANGNAWNIKEGNYYLSCVSGRNWTLNVTEQSGTYTSWAYNNGSFGYDYGTYNGTYYYLYLRTSASNSWEVAFNTATRTGGAYTKGTPTESGYQTTVSFKGVSRGKTYVTIGNVHYTINVSKEDLTNAPALHVQLWITNTCIEKDSNKTTASFNDKNTSKKAQYVTIKATDKLNTDKGILLSECVPQVVENCYEYDGTYWSTRNKSNNSTDGPHTFKLYKGTLLNSSNAQKVWQEDRFYSGEDFQYIRYLDGKWEISEDQLEWTEITDTDGGATKSSYTQQIVAYYLRQTDVTKEVTTYVKDWGYRTTAIPSKNEDRVALTFAVVYPDGTVSPSEDKMYADSTILRNYKTSDFDLGLILPENNSNYNIKKITITNGARTSSSGNYWTSTDSITWEKVTNEASSEWYNETTVWDSSSSTAPVVDGHNKITWSEKDTAKLVLIYLEAVEKEENLKLVYWNDADNCEIKSSQISVSYTAGDPLPTYITALKQKSKVNAGDFTLDDDAYVVNSDNVQQKINKDITIVPDIDAKYRSGVYKYVKAVISEDGYTLTLHYNLDSSRLEHVYILDFGLPLEIPLSDLVKNPNEVDTVLVNTQDLSTTTVITAHGKLSYSKTTQQITFQLEKPFDTNNVLTATFNVRYKQTAGGTTSKDITIGVLPASNVLYEENFLKEETGGSSTISWSQNSTNTITTAQQTQKVGDTGKNVFGYDGAYVGTDEKPVKGQLGVWSVTGLEAGKGLSKALTTEFYGNGFDLIGDCGPTTGRVFLFIEGAGKVLITDIDTRYKDSTLSQVPLAHVMLEQEANYKVTIYAAGLAGETNSTPTSTNGVAAFGGIATYAAAMPVLSYDADLYSALDEMGLTMADVEYVNVSAADSTAVPAVRRAAAASTNGIATYAVTDETTTVKHAAGTHVEIDGFRVYRSSTNNTNYPNAEQNVTYWNILDVVKGNIVAYREGEGTTSASVSVENYEGTGGPQNEIYLKAGQSVAFKLTDSSITSVQVSLRAVAGASNWNNTAISSNTEMYYTLGKDTNGSFMISVPEGTTGMLAIGNVKLPSSVTTDSIQSASEIATEELLLSVRMAMKAAPVEPEPEQPTVFAPEQLDASISTTRFFRNKYITLTVKASADVAKLTVNGKELRPTNSWLVKKGWSDTYTYVLTDTVKKNESRTYEIVAYDASGLASETKTLRAD